MNELIAFYQYLPEKISPTLLSFGFFRLDWYPLMYIIAFLVVFLLLKFRIKNKEADFMLDVVKLENFLWGAFISLVLGARLGYVFLYNFSYYRVNLLEIISPFDSVTHEFVGIYGMSYHGGLLGVLLFSWIFLKKQKINFFKFSNFVVPAIPAGYFFGRIGNFLNGELYGRITERSWGMYFPADSFHFLRHPSQLYEAFFEGLVLFVIFWKFRNCKQLKNKMLGLYLSGYAFFRICIEFFRQPDEQLGYVFSFLTMGQILSLIMITSGFVLIFYSHKNKKVI